MLLDHMSEHAVRLLLVCCSSQSSATPRYLFPDHDTKTITEVEHNARLLIVAKPDKIHTHFFHHYHFLPDKIFRHCSGHTRMVFMALRAADQQSLTIKKKRTMVNESELPESNFFLLRK